jgi:hypothetical protein
VSVEGAAQNFNEAIDSINDAIRALEEIRDSLLVKSGKKLNAAVKKVDKLSIKKLAKTAPAVQKLFKELETDI